MSFRDRIIGLQKVRAGDLMANPANWRKHGEWQAKGLRAVLGKIGFAGALVARVQDGKFVLIDGHLRASLDPEQIVPVLVTDLTEVEAKEVLATYDPLGGMATTDEEALAELLAEIAAESASEEGVEDDFEKLLDDVRDDFGVEPEPSPPKAPPGGREQFLPSATKASGLSWYGGKGKLAGWIASLLPWHEKDTYIEPFCGMAAVLLRRQPVRLEMLNDRSEQVVNWWRVVRDQPEEFGRLVEQTPHSRAEYGLAMEAMNDESLPPIRRALAFHVFVDQGIAHGEGRTGWRRAFIYGSIKAWRSERVQALASRLMRVQLECCDAVDLLERSVNERHVVAYLDPPYPSADITPYTETVDYDRLTEVLSRHKGRLAISGYPGEWDHLGWQQHRRKWTFMRIGPERTSEERTEVVWTNYEVEDAGASA